MKVAARRSLSARGSSSLPRSVISPWERARCPSHRSEKAAIKKMIHAAKRSPKPSTNSRGTRTRARTILPRVIRVGRFIPCTPWLPSAERLDDRLAHRLQRVEHPDPAHAHRLEGGDASGVELLLQLLQG